MKNRIHWLLGVISMGTVIGLLATGTDLTARVAYALDRVQATEAEKRLAKVEDLSTAFEDVANAIKPSVVNISSVRKFPTRNMARGGPQTEPTDPFREFFGDEFFDRFFPMPRVPRDYVQQGLGSGVIVSEEGHILTNNHVVDRADEVTVKLSDERVFRAKVIGTDPKTDLAVIKIDASGLHPATMGDSDAVRIGQWVVAVGNPFGLTNTLTAGIVSAKGRSNMGIVDYEDFIQTDAAINPGNSGGPLLNLRGEVVGINTAIFTRNGGYMGVGFAIPANMASSVMEGLIQDGHVVRGYLGVLIQNMDGALAESFGYEGTDGALVGDVTGGGPGDEAGLRPGDIITRFEGKAISNVTQLRSLVASTRPGTKAQLEVFRDGQHKTLYAQIGELEASPVAANGNNLAADLGMTIRTLTPEMSARLGLDDARGVVVTDIDPFGPAARAGLTENDVIVAVQGTAVTSVSEFRELVAANDLKKGIRMRVRSGTTERFAMLRLMP